MILDLKELQVQQVFTLLGNCFDGCVDIKLKGSAECWAPKSGEEIRKGFQNEVVWG